MGKGSRTRQGTDIKKFLVRFDEIAWNKDKQYCEVCETHYTDRHDRDDCIMALNNKPLDKQS